MSNWRKNLGILILVGIVLGIGGYVGLNPTILEDFPLLAWMAPADNDSIAVSNEKEEKDNSSSEKDENNKSTAQKDKTTILPVRVTPVQQGAIYAALTLSATLESSRKVQVFSRAQGLLEKVFVEEGDVVKKGTALLQLFQDQIKLELQQTQVSLQQLQHDRQQRAKELVRTQQSFQEQLVSAKVLEDAKYALEQTRIQEKQSKINLDKIKLELQHTTVRALIGGTITQKLVNKGDPISPNTHLFDLEDLSSLHAIVHVPERHRPFLKKNQVVDLSLPNSSTSSFTGKILRISPIIDPKNGTVKVTVAVQSQSSVPLFPGTFIQVHITTQRQENARLIPKSAILYQEDQQIVFVLNSEKNKVKRQVIQTGLVEKDQVEVVDGLEPEDHIVVVGQHSLKDGSPVKVIP